MEEKENLPHENKPIKMGITLLHDDINKLIEQVEEFGKTKEVTEVIYNVTTIPIQQQIGKNINVQFKPIASALIFYIGSIQELKELRFSQQLKVG